MCKIIFERPSTLSDHLRVSSSSALTMSGGVVHDHYFLDEMVGPGVQNTIHGPHQGRPHLVVHGQHHTGCRQVSILVGFEQLFTPGSTILK